jgi:hypothetical protein
MRAAAGGYGCYVWAAVAAACAGVCLRLCSVLFSCEELSCGSCLLLDDSVQLLFACGCFMCGCCAFAAWLLYVQCLPAAVPCAMCMAAADAQLLR